MVVCQIVKKRGVSFFNLREKFRTITDSCTSRMKVFLLCLLSQWQVITLAYISGTDFREAIVRASMMVVRSRLQLTLAILKPDLMMHPVRTKVRKVLVRFLRCPIHLFMRQSHIISHKIEWASEVEAYISLMWWACAEILPLLTPETFPCLVPDTPYTSLFLPPDIPLPSYPTSFSLFYPLHSRPRYTSAFFLPQGPFPILF